VRVSIGDLYKRVCACVSEERLSHFALFFLRRAKGVGLHHSFPPSFFLLFLLVVVVHFFL
jgi:hypothetical protein